MRSRSREQERANLERDERERETSERARERGLALAFSVVTMAAASPRRLQGREGWEAGRATRLASRRLARRLAQIRLLKNYGFIFCWG